MDDSILLVMAAGLMLVPMVFAALAEAAIDRRIADAMPSRFKTRQFGGSFWGILFWICAIAAQVGSAWTTPGDIMNLITTLGVWICVPVGLGVIVWANFPQITSRLHWGHKETLVIDNSGLKKLKSDLGTVRSRARQLIDEIGRMDNWNFNQRLENLKSFFYSTLSHNGQEWIEQYRDIELPYCRNSTEDIQNQSLSGLNEIVRACNDILSEIQTQL